MDVTDILYNFLVGPFFKAWKQPVVLLQAAADGAMSAVVYSLIALGYVLIYKASRVFNFAQGILVLFAVLCLTTLNQVAADLLLVATSLAVVVTLGLGLVRGALAPCVATYVAVVVAAVVVAQFVRGPTFLFVAMVGMTLPLVWMVKRRFLDGRGASGYFGVGAACVIASLVWGSMFVVLASTLFVMYLMSVAIERVVLRPLVGQKEMVLFMATIGLFFFLSGLGGVVFASGSQAVPHTAFGIELGTIDLIGGSRNGGISLQRLELTLALVAGAMVIVLTVPLRVTRMGRAVRAIADDPQAAHSVGIPITTIWIAVWTIAGAIALVTGIFWSIGAGGSVTNLISVMAFKALPVLALGGFTSVPGVIAGAFVIGIGEKVAQLYWGDFFDGSIEGWFAYVMVMIILLFRPQGFFGERIIERV